MILREDLKDIGEGHSVPAEGTAPGVGGLPRHRVGPEHLAGGVEGVAVEPARGVESPCRGALELGGDVVEKPALPRRGSIFRIERLAHVEAVEPDLVGIDLLVPEQATLSARLRLQLGEDILHCLVIFLRRAVFAQPQEGARRADVVDVVFFLLVAAEDGAVVRDDVVIPAVDVGEEGRVAVGLVDIEEGEKFQAGRVVPFEGALAAVEPLRLRGAPNLAFDHADREPSRCSAPGKKYRRQYEYSFHHLLLYGSHTMPSCGWNITFSKLYSAAFFGLSW